MPAAWTLRPASAADADALGRAVVEGLEPYRAFAPPGWDPPLEADETRHLLALLAMPEVWCVVAEEAGSLIGQVTVLPAAVAVRPVDEPGLAHLRNLFVRPDRWGSGVARALHDAALGAARERGFAAMRLFAAAGHARARRFYEREGWSQAGEPFFDPIPWLALVEYRIALTGV